MDIIGHSANENSMESIDNYPGNIDDVQFPSSRIYDNLGMDDTSERDCSKQAQQSICFQPITKVVPGEMRIPHALYASSICVFMLCLLL